MNDSQSGPVSPEPLAGVSVCRSKREEGSAQLPGTKTV